MFMILATVVPNLSDFQIVDCLRAISSERLISAKLEVPSFHVDFGPSFDGVTVKDNFAEIKGKRSFGSG